VAGHGSNRGRIEALLGEERFCRSENQDYRTSFGHDSVDTSNEPNIQSID